MKRATAVPLGVFFSSLLLFLLTLYPGVGGRFQWGDAAKWQYLGEILGVPHPPGSPLYVLLSYLWSHIPLPGNTGTRAMAFSAVCGSGAVTLIYLTVRRLVLRMEIALLGAGAFALATPIWTFATEAETYAPLALFFTFVIHRLVAWYQDRRSLDVRLAFLVYAIGFGVHYMMLVLLPALTFVVLANDPGVLKRRDDLATIVASIVLGLLPIIWLWFRIPSAPYSEFVGPRTWSNFVTFVLAGQYLNKSSALSFTSIWFDRATMAVGTLGRAFGYPVLFAVPLGVTALAERDRRLALFVTLGGAASLLFWIAYTRGDDLGGAVPTLPFVVIAICVALQRMVDRLPQRYGLILLAGTALTLAPGVSAMRSTTLRNTPEQRFTHDIDGVKNVFWDLPCIIEHVEPNSVVIPPFEDYGSRQVVYYHQFTNAAVSAKHIDFRYMVAVPKEWAWAPQPWVPSAAERRTVYAYRRSDADRLRVAGFDVQEVSLVLTGCSKPDSAAQYYRAVNSDKVRNPR